MSLKIVQIIPALDAGGAERTVVEITRAIVDAGGQALCITAGGRLEDEVIAAGGQIAHLPVHSKNPYVLRRNVGQIARIAQNFGASLLHARSRAPAWSTRAACRRLNIPFVTTYHGTYQARSAPKRYYNSIMAKGDAVIANSHFIARHITDQHGLAQDQITVIPRGVGPDFFKVPEAPTPPNTNPTILLPGRLTRWKGQQMAIEALALLHRRGCMATLLLAGDAQGRHAYVEALHAQIAAAGLDKSVRFCGHVDNMSAQYAAVDIVLSASIEPEAFGRVAVEGQASARITVAAAHGGALETLVDGQTGFHFAPGDAADLARVLYQTSTLSTQTHQQICQQARKRAAADYSRAAMCAKTLSLYHDLLGKYHP